MSTVLLFVLIVSATSGSCVGENILDYVNPFIGTGGKGFGAGSHNPGAQVPFGILRVGPDTVETIANRPVILPFQHYGGYSYYDNTIVAFSHTHLVGAGVGDLGNFGLMPFQLPPNADFQRLVQHHGSPLLHANEKASPGVYSVQLPNVAHVQVVAAGTHSGSHLYHFTPSPPPRPLPPLPPPSFAPPPLVPTSAVYCSMCATQPWGTEKSPVKMLRST